SPLPLLPLPLPSPSLPVNNQRAIDNNNNNNDNNNNNNNNIDNENNNNNDDDEIDREKNNDKEERKEEEEERGIMEGEERRMEMWYMSVYVPGQIEYVGNNEVERKEHVMEQGNGKHCEIATCHRLYHSPRDGR